MSKSCACKFLYGINTSKDEIAKLENALETHTELKTEIEFYRKNGKFITVHCYGKKEQFEKKTEV